MRKGVTQGVELCKEGYAISKPQGKGLTVLLQTPSRDRRRDFILGPFSCICLEGSFGGQNEGFKG